MAEAFENFLNAKSKMKKKDVVLGNFMGGLAWGFGTVVGATVVVALLVSFAKAFNIPLVNDLVKQLQPVRTQRQLQQPIYQSSPQP